MRIRWLSASLAVLALATAAPASAAGSLTLTEPADGAVVGTTPEFTGTGFTDGTSGVMLVVDGPTPVTTSAPVYGDGTWAVSGRQLDAGSYTAQACQSDASGAQACTPTVAFTVRATGGGGFTAKRPYGSFRDLLAGRLKMAVHCPQDCTVAARLIVAAQDARRMGFPQWRTNQLVATESDQDTFAAGDAKLGLAVFPGVRRRLRDALAFPLFGRVGIKVELQADWGEGSFITSVTGRLLWPGVGGDRGGRRGSIRGIDVDEPVYLDRRQVAATVRLARGSGAVTAGVRSAGAAVRSTDFTILAGGRPASPAQLRRGGTFRVIVRWGTAAARDAGSVAPLAAELYVRRGATRAARRFTIRG